MLRPYQQTAVDKCLAYLRATVGIPGKNPVICLPTGGGKTHLIAELCRIMLEHGGRVLILAHVRELLEQTRNKLAGYVGEQTPVGVYCAGLGMKDTSTGLPIVVASVQSLANDPLACGLFEVVIIDESHMVPADGEGRYHEVINALQSARESCGKRPLRIIGLTATPYRMTSGLIYGEQRLFADLVHDVRIGNLIEQGYLCPIIAKAPQAEQANTTGLHIRGGEFINSEIGSLMSDAALTDRIVESIISKAGDRKSILVFCAVVEHAELVRDSFADHGVSRVDCVFGDTPSAKRTETLSRFAAGDLLALCNVGVLTTGFDSPRIDCIALLRPTMSPGLYYQMVGRGLRIMDGKANCLVLDYCGNAQRHGPIDHIIAGNDTGERRSKDRGRICKACECVYAVHLDACPECGAPWQTVKREWKANDTPDDDAEFVSGAESRAEQYQADRRPGSFWYDVLGVSYYAHTKKGAEPGTPQTLRVEYEVLPLPANGQYPREFICVEHKGWVYNKAVKWWRDRTDIPVPATAEEAAAMGYELKMPSRILVAPQKDNPKYTEICGFTWGEVKARIDDF